MSLCQEWDDLKRNEWYVTERYHEVSQARIVREWAYTNVPKLLAHIESLHEAVRLKDVGGLESFVLNWERELGAEPATGGRT